MITNNVSYRNTNSESGRQTNGHRQTDRCTYCKLSSSALQSVSQQVELFDFTELLFPLITAEALLQPGITLHTHTHTHIHTHTHTHTHRVYRSPQ